ncbi:MAG: thymidylate synthase [Candidatus Pacearchaeota archaeon]
MRIFHSLYSAASEIQRDLFEFGVEYQSNTWQNKIVKEDSGFRVKELISYVYLLHLNFIWIPPSEIPSSSLHLNEVFDLLEIDKIKREKIKNFVSKELVERIASAKVVNPEAWKEYPELWEKFRLPDGSFDYTYPERLCLEEKNQLDIIKMELKTNPNSRQCLATIWRISDLNYIGGSKRVPCSIYYQFMRRRGSLYLIYNMRSCDFYNHWIIDTLLGLCMADYMAVSLGLSDFYFIHQINSFHIFEKDYLKRGIF